MKTPIVLLIDDVKTNLMVLESILTKEGFGVLKAINGHEGRFIASTSCPDLILLDIYMPEEDGFETCQKLKTDPKTADIPVIFISTIQDVVNKVKGFELGAVDYITKPFENAEVLARTRLHLRFSQARSSLIEAQKAKLHHLAIAQQALLPRPEDFPEANFAVVYQPIQEAGGDFYEVVRISPGIFGYFVADVSGHDLGSSLTTSAFKALIQQNASPLYTPQESMKIINSVLGSILPEGQYLTVSYAQINRLRHSLITVSAGHPPGIYIEPNGCPYLLAEGGDLIGIFDSVSLEVKEIKISKGGRLFLYSDGLIEYLEPKPKSRKESINQLLSLSRKTLDLPLAEAVTRIVEHLSFGHVISDDLLLLGIEI